jgi:galactokinase
VRVYAVDFADASAFSLDAIERSEDETWSNYERGVAWALQGHGLELVGADLAITSDIPIASGLSSSAAIEVATACAFQTLGEFELDGVNRALLCQKAENDFVGMRCGIMDQYIISLGRRGHALLIDCRSLDYELVPVPHGCSLIVCDTKKRRGLVDSEYNMRRMECERGAEVLGVPALRDVSVEAFVARQDALDERTRKRCRHVVTENQRVVDAVGALHDGDLGRFGQLMNESHVSLRDDYEVSCDELDAMVEAAWRQPGVLGARMTGAGFGGCTVNLVREEAAAAFVAAVGAQYAEATGLKPEIYVCRAEEGVHTLD